MKLTTNDQTVALVSCRMTADGCVLVSAAPVTPGDTLEITADDGTELRRYTVADWLRCEVDGCRLTLSNRPTPEPMPVDLDALCESKHAEISAASQAAIYAGMDVQTTQGTEHFSLTDQDQINLTTAKNAIDNGAPVYPYHTDDTLCRIFTAEEIKAIAQASVAHIIYHTTYCNHLFDWIRRADAVELAGITYGAELPEDLAAHMQEILTQAGAVAETGAET